jgi:hypothetical protein
MLTSTLLPLDTLSSQHSSLTYKALSSLPCHLQTFLLLEPQWMGRRADVPPLSHTKLCASLRVRTFLSWYPEHPEQPCNQMIVCHWDCVLPHALVPDPAHTQLPVPLCSYCFLSIPELFPPSIWEESQLLYLTFLELLMAYLYTRSHLTPKIRYSWHS